MISTVSPRYADEIMYPYAGYALAPLIQRRSGDLRGILNGLGLPALGPGPATRAWPATLTLPAWTLTRPPNKRHLQALAGLPVRGDLPWWAWSAAWAAQKGFDLALPALRQILAEREMQLSSWAAASQTSRAPSGSWSKIMATAYAPSCNSTPPWPSRFTPAAISS